MGKTRNETEYRDMVSKSGTFSPKISRVTAERLTRYCKIKNINRTKFAECCINERLDVLEGEYLQTLSKEELISLLMKG